ncbi:sigma 54-interacting transcriptional regulator [Mucilaginibacter aquaedulcis]|uniref:sigma 54-interacting transcriptional regulator n=1 Tax=Mucilaginibacter aquaedulcis TaxID=1187081 RepID=UPI0025B462F7|nr:sigma 54-interacting transcriptional regulator [Mucilaginibacter aquaedulcis]MDN3548887.1 sigma 54-interacting transcriptional regulator [Mucilaginibacter aquaedulcis]
MSGYGKSDLFVEAKLQDRKSENEELLDLSCEIALVRDREKLLLALHGKIKKLIPFNDIIITLYDHHLKTHHAFLFYSESKRRNHPDFDKARAAHSPIEDGVVNKTLESIDPVIFQIDELLRNPNPPVYVRFYKKSGIREFVGVSMNNSSGTFGGLYIFSEHKNTYFPDQFGLIKTIANQIASTVTNILIHDEIVRKEGEKSILLNVGNDLATLSHREALPDVLLARLNSVFDFDHVVISLYDADAPGYFGYGYKKESMLRLNPSHRKMLSNTLHNNSFLQYEISNERFAKIYNLEEMAVSSDGPDFALACHAFGMKELIVAPLLSDNKIRGFLLLVSEVLHDMGKSQFELIRSVSYQVSNAVTNMIARDELRARDHEKSMLLDLSNELAAARSKHDLHIVVNESMRKLLPYHNSVTLKISSDENWLNAFLLDPQSKSQHQPEYNKLTTGRCRINKSTLDLFFSNKKPLVFDLYKLIRSDNSLPLFQMNYNAGMREVTVSGLSNGKRKTGILMLFSNKTGHFRQRHLTLIESLASQLASAMANIIANEQIAEQVAEISNYKKQLEAENTYLQEEIQFNHNHSEIIGTSPALRRVFNLVSNVARTNSSVLILGETGTGKELIARAIHNESPRKDRLMIKVNCATLPANLIESELFGHERGSFTGATEKRIGKFELANNGTLFLDEIGEMPMDLQVKILRALQEREIERIGGRSTIKTDVRIIAATNRDLEQEVLLGRFRSDLYYRLNVFPIMLPPLRERKEDLQMLATHFLFKHAKKAGKHVSGLSERLLGNLDKYNWPGNVRELEHMIERCVLLANQPVIDEMNLPESYNPVDHEPFMDESCIKTIDELEREHIINVLKFCQWKVGGVGGAAEILKIPSTTLNSKMKKLGIKKGIFGD